MGRIYDEIVVSFKNYQFLWYSNEIYQELNKRSYVLSARISKQNPNTQAVRDIKKYTEDTKTILLLSVVTAFIMNVILSGQTIFFV